MEAAAEEEQAVLRSLLDDSNYTAHSTDWTTVLPACRVAVPMEDPAARVAARVGSLTVTLNIGEQQAGGSDGNGVCTLFSIAPPDARTGSDRGLTVCVAQVPKPTTDVVGRRERHVLAFRSRCNLNVCNKNFFALTLTYNYDSFFIFLPR